MHCQSCNYPLWNLAARECPECGLQFRPSDFDFVVNSVRFCCPHCDEAYYGTGARGHLVPAEFQCTACGRDVAMDDMVLRPTEGVGTEQTRVDRMPWLERGERGFVRAWTATVGAAMSRPSSLMRAIPPHVSIWRSWAFMAGTNFVFALANAILSAVIAVGVMAALLRFMGQATGSGSGGTAVTGLPAGIGLMLAGPALAFGLGGVVAVMVVPLLWAWLTHVLLVAVGGVSAPMRRTFQAMFYSVGPSALGCVPADCARFVGRIWWAVAAILMLKQAHGCTGGRATFAVLTSGFVTVVVSLVLFLGSVFVLLGGTSMFGSIGGAVETQFVLNALHEHGKANGGAGPPHAALLVTDQNLGEANFMSDTSATTAIDVPVADTTLDDLRFLPPNRKRIAAAAAADLLPDGVVAHRLGDYVFTYHGVDLSVPSPRWVVVMIPDPDVNGPPDPARTVTIGLADGSIVQVDQADLAAELGAENRARAADGLPPLPDPATVTHARSAGGR